MGINDFIKIGTKIKEVRKKKGIKQKEMAKKLDIPVSTYANYENNHREPSTEMLDAIADVLGVSVSELLGFDSFNSFINYLKSIGYTVEIEPEVLEWHYEDVVENGKVIGRTQIADKETYTVTITKDKVSTTFTKAEFEEFQTTIKNSVDYQVWLKNNK
jgi:transcriptional regulator with XRE-family HTH domain